MYTLRPALRRDSGFGHLLVIVIIVLVIAGAATAGWLVWQKQHKADVVGDTGWQADCSGAERVAMRHEPMDMANVASVAPLGLTAGAHVTPIDHLYFYPKDSSRDKFPVYAMADGAIIDITVRAVNVDSGQARPPEYRLIMQHSCQTVSYYDLITKLDQSILDKFPKGATEGMHGRFPIKAGQVVGWIGGQSLDTSIYNLDLTLPGFHNPKLYEAEPWKLHTDDFFSYFSEPLKSEMLAKNMRQAEPRSGKIDYDQAGKLIGNWFQQGTNGYAGVGSGIGKDGKGYWSTHLAVIPFAYDPSQIVVSLGSFQGQPRAFGVVGNAPDPATVTAGSGPVKYQLVEMPQGVGSPAVNPNATRRGTVLLQVMTGEKLRVEVFPGRTPDQVADFSKNALIYVR